jgi:hypothetical protein
MLGHLFQKAGATAPSRELEASLGLDYKTEEDLVESTEVTLKSFLQLLSIVLCRKGRNHLAWCAG